MGYAPNPNMMPPMGYGPNPNMGAPMGYPPNPNMGAPMGYAAPDPNQAPPAPGKAPSPNASVPHLPKRVSKDFATFSVLLSAAAIAIPVLIAVATALIVASGSSDAGKFFAEHDLSGIGNLLALLLGLGGLGLGITAVVKKQKLKLGIAGIVMAVIAPIFMSDSGQIQIMTITFMATGKSSEEAKACAQLVTFFKNGPKF